INYKIDDPATKVEVDYSEFLEVMHVLVENAIDAISARGAISVTINKSENKAIISVSNDGETIDKENLHRIFDPYFTTKKHGTGMGLAIAKKILEDHNTKLELKIEDGKTVFFFSLAVC
ncbi:MAG: ATP-binding protein, partial [Candidatus Cloacimonetes bacterium]|nr:ATP-binding protein [Candidatus Cloacimonadota bacterium]MCF8262300.1 ATP-binding protein [Melioribacteraceae bacterium]